MTSAIPRRKPGACCVTDCDLGADARRATCVTLSGKQVTLSLCGECMLTPENLPSVWRRVIATNFDAAKAREGSRTLARQWELGAQVLWITADRPIGVLHVQLLREV